MNASQTRLLLSTVALFAAPLLGQQVPSSGIEIEYPSFQLGEDPEINEIGSKGKWKQPEASDVGTFKAGDGRGPWRFSPETMYSSIQYDIEIPPLANHTVEMKSSGQASASTKIQLTPDANGGVGARAKVTSNIGDDQLLAEMKQAVAATTNQGGGTVGGNFTVMGVGFGFTTAVLLADGAWQASMDSEDDATGWAAQNNGFVLISCGTTAHGEIKTAQGKMEYEMEAEAGALVFVRWVPNPVVQQQGGSSGSGSGGSGSGGH